MTFSDFQPTPDHPQYFTRQAVTDYYRSYAEHFKLNEHIRYNTRVIKVRKTPDHDSTGRWEVFTCPTTAFQGGDKSPGLDASQEDLNRCQKEVFDVVLVCSGYFKTPQYPDIPGLDSFPGHVSHSFHYKSGVPFEGKKVMVVGNSFSSGDIANDIALNTDKVVELSVGKGTWIVPRIAPGGIAFDRTISREILYRANEETINNLMIDACQTRMDHIGSGINPPLPPSRSSFMFGDDIYLKILTDQIRVQDQLERFEGSTAVFKNGERISGIDAVVFATGYTPEASFVDIDLVQDDGRMDLFHMMLPLNEKHHSLAFVGVLSGDSPIGPPTELQSRYMARLITGKMPPPPRKHMEANVKLLNHLAFARKQRYTNFLPLFLVSDLIAKDIGVYPSFWRVFMKDPTLACRVWYGPMFSIHYRLLGPDSDWDTARAASYRAHEVLTEHVAPRGKIEIKRVDASSKTGRMLLALFGISAVAAVGYVGKTQGWFEKCLSDWIRIQ